MKRIITYIMIALAFMLIACSPPRSTADREQAAATKRAMNEANRRLGMPGVTTYLEKQWLKYLYELRDKKVATFTYVADMHGNLHHVCDSVGYGMNASIQYSNPEREAYRGQGGYGTLPQPEPNGLFMPEGLEATYILCVDEDHNATPTPIYSEPQLVVSPFRLRATSSWQVNPPAEQVID